MDNLYELNTFDRIGLYLIGLFYLFFFIRAFLLSRKIGKSIKSRDPVLNLAITAAGITTLLFLVATLFPAASPYLVILAVPAAVKIAGLILIALGLAISSLASVNLGKSWRVGIDHSEKTELVQSGIYGISRNPYFLSYNAVLLGIVLTTASLVVLIPAGATILLFHQLILKEEKFLEKMHGEDYIDYTEKVGRYL